METKVKAHKLRNLPKHIAGRRSLRTRLPLPREALRRAHRSDTIFPTSGAFRLANQINVQVHSPNHLKLNDFAKAYAGITLETGTLKLATEMTSNDGRFNGYVEPVFDHMAVFNPAHDSDNPIDFVWQGIVGGLTRMIRNQPNDRFGTKAPFSGSFEDPKTAVMTTIFNVFRNAFIQAFTGTLSENKQDLPKVDPEKKKD